MKEIEEDRKKWKDSPCSWIRTISTVKMFILSKAIYRFSIILIKIPMAFFTEIEEKNPKICVESQKTPKRQRNMRKKNKAGGITLPDFKQHYKVIVIKTICYWHKKRHINHWNRIESPEINPCMIVDKGAKITQ